MVKWVVAVAVVVGYIEVLLSFLEMLEKVLEKVLALMLVAMLVLDADAVQLCWGLN